MKILHLSDLHIGKMIGSYSLLEDQAYCLNQILTISKEEKIDLVLIAGDIFDTAIPSAEAMQLYSSFIEALVFKLKVKVVAISGNHDSYKRLDVNREFFKKSSYYIIGDYKGEVLSFEDKYGKVNIYPIPYLSLSKARVSFDKDFQSFTDLYSYLLKDIDYSGRNILLTHCYASENTYEDKEEETEGEKPLSIGGNDAMDASLFKNFDYVALGHLHRKHFVLEPKIRYSGTFMKYSFSEKGKKSVSLIDFTDKVEISEIEISPLRDFVTIEDYFDNILAMDKRLDYVQVILLDDYPIENAMAKLKVVFPNAVNIRYKDFSVFNKDHDFDLDIENLSTLELFKEFYKFKMKNPMSEKEIEIFKKVIE
ncbi:MAG: exonuclease SbcCD subunit D [Peptoniphilaceae bacterium]|nr:exonuclease SbcCD subunit D [Peptoniphilaceae bacterium]MDY6019243.1 exonuclease SbcCD subunit D [Anaerococcus sp.]